MKIRNVHRIGAAMAATNIPPMFAVKNALGTHWRHAPLGRGGSVKQNARAAAKRASVKRARRLGHVASRRNSR